MNNNKILKADRELRKVGITCFILLVIFLPSIPMLFIIRSRFADALRGTAPVPVEQVKSVVGSFETITITMLCVFCVTMCLTGYSILKYLKEKNRQNKVNSE